MERLDKTIVAAGKASRREVKELVRQGRVSVNGVIANSPEQKVDPDEAVILLDGETISCGRMLYVLLHKPGDVLTATADKRQKTVMDLLPAAYRRRDLSPVGRLDKDTEGLLLLTNDGELNHRLTSPKHHVDKVYFARVEGKLLPEDCRRFADGIELQDLTCLPATLEILTEDTCLVTVREGKFHQVKRMLGSCGKTVVYLKRLRMGPLILEDTLPVGDCRLLREEEVATLRESVGL